MIRYWKYVICPLFTEQGFSNIAMYNCSKELFLFVLQYCKEHNGSLHLMNNFDFISESFLKENKEWLFLEHSSQEESICLDAQVLLAEKTLADRNHKADLAKLHMPECRMIVSNLDTEKEEGFRTFAEMPETFLYVKGIPFGGINFYLEAGLKSSLENLLHAETLWNAVEAERSNLECALQKKNVKSFTEKSCIYNNEALLRKEEIKKVKVEYKKKIKNIKNSKRYKIGSKIADMGNLFSSNKKEQDTEAAPRKRRLDQLAEHFEISETKDLFELYLNYSPLLKSLRMPLSKCEQAVIEEMESLRTRDREKFQTREQDDLVSVIMPSYNRADIIEDAIASVLRQSYCNFELIIVDDFSTDHTSEIVKKYADDKRVRYIMNTHMKGVCGARNTGLAAAKGTWIAYLDSDNEWEEDYLLLSIHKLKENPQYHSIYTAQKIWKLDKSEKVVDRYRFGVYSPAMSENRNYVDLNSYVHSSAMYQNYGGFDEGLRRMTDWELILRYSRHEIPYSYPVVLCDYYEEGKQQDRISDVENENYSLFATRYNANKLGLEEADTVIETGYEMYSNADSKVYTRRKEHPAIIIPNYEALGCLNLCIASIRKFSRAFDYEIIIVDNCSSQIVQDYLQSIAGDADVKVIQNDYNMGFTYAVNQGIKAARPGSDYILLNNDAIVTENWLEELYEVKYRIPDAGLIVPRQVLIPHTRTMDVHVPGCNKNREMDVNLSFHHKNITDITTYAKEGYVELSFAAFFLVMITDKCFEKLGLLDEVNGRHYKSDRLYCEKAAENGIKMIYTPFSKAYHLLQQSTVQLRQQNQEMYEIIFRKNNWDDFQGKIPEKA